MTVTLTLNDGTRLVLKNARFDKARGVVEGQQRGRPTTIRLDSIRRQALVRDRHGAVAYSGGRE